MNVSASSTLHPLLSSDTMLSVHRHMNEWLRKGAIYVSLPWVVPEPFVQHTQPSHIDQPQGQTREGLCVVASGEQSFLQLTSLKNFDPNVVYVGWTPCFRQEPYWDATHHHYFLKAEAYVPLEAFVSEEEIDLKLTSMVHHAKDIFASFLPPHLLPFLSMVQVFSDHPQWDLMLGDIEIGSYGVRTHPSHPSLYIYATVCAEPRLSCATSVLNDRFPLRICDF